MSDIWRLNWTDIIHGFITAIVGAFAAGIYQMLSAGTLPDMATLKTAGMGALLAGLSFLVKQFMSNSQNQVLKTEQK